MLVVDANILSTFARIGKTGLLRELFGRQTLYLTPGSLEELRRAVAAGCDFLSQVLDGVEPGGDFDVVPLSRQEVLVLPSLPSSLGAGERESVAVCLSRRPSRMLTNDKRARNLCREKGIPCLDLPTILRALWKRRILSRQQAREMVREIETMEGLVFKDKENIFK